MDVITYAVPLFLASMAAEWWWSRRHGKTVFTYADTITNLAIALFSEVAGLVVKLVQLAAYTAIFHYLAVTEWPMNAWTWVVAFVGVDFCYYWFHRMSHEWNAFWVFHIVHHQSEQYNLSVALRQSAFGSVIGWIFYAPLAVLGVPPLVFATCYALNLVYQFFIHTRLVDRLGWFEAWFNTPSHHRVHHGINRSYLDKNYAGVLMIWDRMFGTFTPETEPVVYGTVRPYRHFHAVRANWDPLRHLWKQMQRAPSRMAALSLLVRPPGWEFGDRNNAERVERALVEKRPESKEPPPPRRASVVWLALVAATVLTVIGMLMKPLGVLHLVLVATILPLLHGLAFSGRSPGD